MGKSVIVHYSLRAKISGIAEMAVAVIVNYSAVVARFLTDH